MTNPAVQPAIDLALSRRFLTLGDVGMLVDLAARAVGPEPCVIDLGAGAGTTALCILLARPEARVLSVDISDDALNWAQQAIENCGVADRWGRLTSDAGLLGWNYPGPPVDLLLIDTSHESRATARELAAWLPHVRPGGLVWLHDYAGEDYPGVRKAVDRAVGTGALVEYGQAGLGWAGVRP